MPNEIRMDYLAAKMLRRGLTVSEQLELEELQEQFQECDSSLAIAA